MVDAIISAVVEDLTSILRSSIKEEVKLVTGVNDEVKKLVSNLKSIQALLDEAEERQLEEASVKNWLLNLKAVSYDMDDVIDEWKTWIQTSQFQNQHQSSGSNQSQLKHKVLSIFRCIRFIKRRHVVARKIREILQRLDDIAVEKERYQLSPSQKTENKYIERRMTTPFIIDMEVKGRDKEKEKIKSQILKAKSNPHIISLVGLGGIGKTTLAQLVYNDSDIQSHFEKKIWVCVSKPFDKIRIAKAILESVCEEFGRGDSAHFQELGAIMKEIRTVLNERKFFLVLDDVWNDNSKEWEELGKLFRFGSEGTTIMITTRNEKVAIAIGCKPESRYKIEGLTSEQCWSIINQIALPQGDCQKFESIGKRIADKCKGLPLAATTIGGILRFKKSEEEWQTVLEKKEWEWEHESEGILGLLKLSYYDLMLPLKHCFSYCAIFPQDYEIEKRRLIGMWMVQGYLKGKKDHENLEIVGETCFENLIARSLFQTQSNNDNVCTMHGIVIELAQSVAKNECLILNDREPNRNILHLDDVRHLCLVIEKNAPFPIFVYGLNKLRSLIIQFVRYKSLTVVELKGIFDHLTCLRTLDLSRCEIEEIPSSINRLVHLRWLDLSNNEIIEKLPETLCECYNLQILILNRCRNLVKLPKRIGKLVNLMYLDIASCAKIKYLPKGIGTLWHLRELTVFIISENESESFSIVEMENLNDLRGRLEIRGLGNVRKLEEARKAQLKEKEKVTELSLSFDPDYVQEDEEELLEALEPPLDLKILRIAEFKGKTFPSWMMKLNRLRKLTIDKSRNCKELPPLGKLLCLEELELRHMRVKRVGVEFMGIEKEKDASTSFPLFPSLKKLSFEQFLEWEEWDDIEKSLMERIDNKTITIMPSLQKLCINFCPNLRTLPYLLLSPSITTRFEELDIYDCDVLEEEIQKDKLSHKLRFDIKSADFAARTRNLRKVIRKEETNDKGDSSGGVAED